MAKLTTNIDSRARERAEFEILPTRANSPVEVDIDGRRIRLGPKGMTTIRDYGLAKEIDARYGHDGGDQSLLMVPVQRRQDPDHQRTFRVSLPRNYKRQAKKFGG